MKYQCKFIQKASSPVEVQRLSGSYLKTAQDRITQEGERLHAEVKQRAYDEGLSHAEHELQGALIESIQRLMSFEQTWEKSANAWIVKIAQALAQKILLTEITTQPEKLLTRLLQEQNSHHDLQECKKVYVSPSLAVALNEHCQQDKVALEFHKDSSLSPTEAIFISRHGELRVDFGNALHELAQSLS